MRTIRFVLAAALLSMLQACEGTYEQLKAMVKEIPLVNIVKEPSGKETVLTGTIQPHINFSSTLETQSPDGIKCSGKFNSRGVGTLTCTNGWNLDLEIPKGMYGTPNGSYVETSNGVGVAVGWGSDAKVDVLRAKM